MSVLTKKNSLTIFSLVFLMTKVTVFTTSPIDKHKLSVHFQPKGRKFHPWPNDTDCQHFKTQFATKGSLTWSSSSSLWLCSWVWTGRSMPYFPCLHPYLASCLGLAGACCQIYQKKTDKSAEPADIINRD